MRPLGVLELRGQSWKGKYQSWYEFMFRRLEGDVRKWIFWSEEVYAKNLVFSKTDLALLGPLALRSSALPPYRVL